MKAIASSGVLLLTVIAASLLTSCGGGSSPVVFPVSVSVSATANSVLATAGTSVTATLTNDSTGQGVNWTVSCSVPQCGSVSPAITTSGNPATYTAPSTPPTSDLAVTIKATSRADSSKSGSAQITVLAITMSVSPNAANVQVGANSNLQITATVNNDPSGQGVSWAMSPASGAGSLTNQNISSVTYIPPASPPASDLIVTITATSIEDPTKTSVATITVPSVVVSISLPVSSVRATTLVPNVIATVTNDPTNKGVKWTLSCSAAPCGTIAPASTASGAATTYTAPTTPPPADLQVTLTATSVADSTASSSVIITVLAITVSVSTPSSSVQFGQSVPNIVATVNNDPAGKGVTWAVQTCAVAQCGSVSPTSSASGAPVTYSAPGTPPASDLSVTLVATSASDPMQQGSTSITVLAIRVAVAICADAACSFTGATAGIPVSATAALNATPVDATVTNDTNNQGVTWTLTQSGAACSPACGSLSPMTTASATPTTYAAPPTLPSSAAVTVTATSVTDNTQSASATITLVAGTVKLIPADLHFGKLKITSGTHPKSLRSLMLINTGASSLDITAQAANLPVYTVTGPCQGSIVTSVASGGSCVIALTFAPLVVGTYNGALSLTDNDVASPQLVPLFGVACVNLRNCFGGASVRAAIAENRTPAVPPVSGSNQVGTQVLNLKDVKRVDPYAADGSPRELQVRFWYPASGTGSCKRAPYTSPAVLSYMANIEKVAVPEISTNSCQDAQVAPGAHPVVVFTHGYTGTSTDYTFLFEDLASRGYVVASVNHTFEATAVELPGGRLVTSVLGSHLQKDMQLDDATTTRAVAVRLADLRFVMDELQRLNTGTAGPFAGKLDLSQAVLAGHSLGGMTALLGIELEDRFVAGISLDGLLPGPLFGTTSKPVFLLFAGREAWDKETCGAWSKLQGVRLAVDLKGAEHLTPTDAVWLARGAVQTGSMDVAEMVAAIRDYTATFLDATLKGAPLQPLLTNLDRYPGVEVTTAAQSRCAEAPVRNGN